MVESIVRNRTWSLMGERCEIEPQGFEKALDDWRKKTAEQMLAKPVVQQLVKPAVLE